MFTYRQTALITFVVMFAVANSGKTAAGNTRTDIPLLKRSLSRTTPPVIKNNNSAWLVPIRHKRKLPGGYTEQHRKRYYVTNRFGLNTNIEPVSMSVVDYYWSIERYIKTYCHNSTYDNTPQPTLLNKTSHSGINDKKAISRINGYLILTCASHVLPDVSIVNTIFSTHNKIRWLPILSFLFCYRKADHKTTYCRQSTITKPGKRISHHHVLS